jgi:hypothetical protein
MLTGSMVSNYWGVPRTTHDLDFVIQVPGRSEQRLIEEFRGDYVLDEEGIRAAYQPPYQFNAIDTRSALKVDFWLLQPRPFERTMFDRRLEVTLFGERAWICTAEDAILHKLYWNNISPSERQIGDAANVITVQSDNLDFAYLTHWATELGVLGVLADLRRGSVPPKQT